MFDLDPILLARIQFAFTVSFHIVFPAFTIGLASFLAVVEWRWLKTGDERYHDIYKFWVKIFAVAFGMGVVSGVTMSYQFGTNWSVFSDRVANVLGPLLGYEVLTAFFLEASFLGIMLFGWGRVSKQMHFVSTCIVAAGCKHHKASSSLKMDAYSLLIGSKLFSIHRSLIALRTW
jgi:cytochrome d ubiquinol oxidase subunit I